MKKKSMAKAKDTSMHWIIGVVLIVTGALVVTALVSTYSQAQANLTNANVNVNNEAPSILSWLIFQDSSGTPTLSPIGMLPGVVGASYNVIVNVNIGEKNGLTDDPVTLKMRLIRSKDGQTNFNAETASATNAFNDPSTLQTTRLPMSGPVTCDLYGTFDAGTGVNTGGSYRCFTKIYYFSDPTDDSTSVDTGVDYSAEDWSAALKADDSNGGTTGIDVGAVSYIEYPNILGLTSDTSIAFGTTDTSGTPTAVQSVNVENKGNQKLDVALEVNKQTDATAWTCTGTGRPLATDVHYTINSGDLNYNVMTALSLNLANSGQQETGFDLVRTTVTGSESKTFEKFRFATTQPVGAGTCTLSSIVLTALKGY